MITFKQFLSESRTKVTSVEEFINWADKNAKGYLQGPHFFYRGGSGAESGKFLIGNSAVVDRPRKSANTVNNYTLWMDNHPSFKYWPKRSLSWIAADSLEIAENFGYDNTHLLVVKDTNDVGIVGADDLWNIELPHIDIDIDTFNDMTQALIDKDCETINELVDALKDYTFDMFKSVIEKTSDDNQAMHSMFEYMESENMNSLYDLWEAVFTPDIFQGYTDAANASGGASNGEVWIEGQVGFIPTSVKNISDEDIETIMNWAQNYSEFHDVLMELWGLE